MLTIKDLIPNISEVVPYTFEEHKSSLQAFENVLERMLSSIPSQKKPEIVHMLGIPGSGKSTYYRQHRADFASYLLLDFDRIMEAMDGYQKDIQTIGNVEAFNKWQIPARVAGYELLKRAIEAKKNIFFDHGGTPMCHRELLANVKLYGYTTKMVCVPCEVDVALQRVKARELITHRHTPPQMIIDRSVLIEKNLPFYQNLVDVFETAE